MITHCIPLDGDEAASGPSRPEAEKDDSAIEMIRRYMAAKLGFLDNEENSHEKVRINIVLNLQ